MTATLKRGQRTQPAGVVDGAELRDDLLLSRSMKSGCSTARDKVAAVADPVRGAAHDGARPPAAAVGLGGRIAPRWKTSGKKYRRGTGPRCSARAGCRRSSGGCFDRPSRRRQAGDGGARRRAQCRSSCRPEHHRLLALGVDGVSQLAHPGAHEAPLGKSIQSEGAGGDTRKGELCGRRRRRSPPRSGGSRTPPRRPPGRGRSPGG